MIPFVKLAIVAVALFVIAALLLPLATFFSELAISPDKVPKLFIRFRLLNRTHILLILNLSYGGSLILKDLTVRIVNKTIYFGDVSKGTYVKEVVVPIAKIRESNKEIFIRFILAGLYPIRVNVRY